MPFDGIPDPQTLTMRRTLYVLRDLLDFFDNGDRWCRARLSDRKGRYCLVGALRHLRRTRKFHGDRAGHYLRLALGRDRSPHPNVISFNDACRSYHQVRQLLLSALEIAGADLERRPRPQQPFMRAPPPWSPGGFAFPPLNAGAPPVPYKLCPSGRSNTARPLPLPPVFNTSVRCPPCFSPFPLSAAGAS